MNKILPEYIMNILRTNTDIKKIFELRFRASKPISINYGGEFSYLTKHGLSSNIAGALIADGATIQGIVMKACDYSLYAVSKQLACGYLTIAGGIRLGVCGETVYSGKNIGTLKDFSSINIRIPHEVIGCSDKVLPFILDGGINNTLIISPPACGKTTLLRDIARSLGNAKPVRNIMIVDERSEIAAVNCGAAQLDVGSHSDIMSNCDKDFAFSQAVRCMRPDVIITDELGSDSDYVAVESVTTCGIKVIASVHGLDCYDIMNKRGFEQIVKKKIFDKYIVLSNSRGIGTCEGIFDKDFNAYF